MIYWQLFLSFLKIGALAFGGGAAMLSLILDEVLAHGWMTEAELMQMFAVSESTPGPIAVNAATFIGSQQGGLPGAVLATLGVVLPSFLIILFISAVLRRFLEYRAVRAVMQGIRPTVIALILAMTGTLALSILFGFGSLGDAFNPDLGGLGILLCVAVAALLYRRLRRRRPPPILVILVSAVLGLLVYGR